MIALDLIHKLEALPDEERKWATQWFIGSLESDKMFKDVSKDDSDRADWAMDKLKTALNRVLYCICKDPDFTPSLAVNALCSKCGKLRYNPKF